LPSTSREVRELLVELGIEYKKINSCKNDFILYIDGYQKKVEFHICKEKRYRTDVQGPIVPKKVLRHMPVIPRLQQIFNCMSLAQLMDMYAKNMIKNGFTQIPSDSKVMKHTEEK
jgi:hypothetical protein